MKLIEYSWKETRRIKVPDECPSDEFIDMRIFIRNNIDAEWDFEDEDN